ncbi:MAG: TetR/AcrR family transcriptional regulator [Gammaproteobacteria bacterium]|nr:TetR/AcrR family transcriptional regulator [Gammaproteobacteria bacterium]
MDPVAESASSQRRQATEEKLLDALETVLVRDGIRDLRLNAVVEEAGVSKPLLYRYFDNLPGLLSAWAERRGGLSAGHLATHPVPTATGDDEDFMARLAEQLVTSAAALREQPIMLEMLAEELTANSELSDAFAKVRRRQSKAFVREMLSDPRYTEPRVRGKIIVLYAAINYLAMRAARSPNFMGLRLNTRKGWDNAMEMIRAIVLDGDTTDGAAKCISPTQTSRGD